MGGSVLFYFFIFLQMKKEDNTLGDVFVLEDNRKINLKIYKLYYDAYLISRSYSTLNKFYVLCSFYLIFIFLYLKVVNDCSRRQRIFVVRYHQFLFDAPC